MQKCIVCEREATVVKQVHAVLLIRCENEGNCKGLEFIKAPFKIKVTTETLHIFLKATSKLVCR